MADEKELRSLLPEESLTDGGPEPGAEDAKTEITPIPRAPEATEEAGGGTAGADSGAAGGTDSGESGPAGPATGFPGKDTFKPVFGLTILSDGTFEHIQLIPAAEFGEETVECPASVAPILLSILKDRLDTQNFALAVQEGLRGMTYTVKLNDGRVVTIPLADYIASNVVNTLVQVQSKMAEDSRIMAALANGRMTPGGHIIRPS